MAAIDRDPTTVSPIPTPTPTIAPAGVPKYVLDYGKKFERRFLNSLVDLDQLPCSKFSKRLVCTLPYTKRTTLFNVRKYFPSDGSNFNPRLYHRHTSLWKMCCLLIHVSRCSEFFVTIYFLLLVFLGEHKSNLIPQPL